MDNESKLNVIEYMNDITTNIDDIGAYMFIASNNRNLLLSASVSSHDVITMCKYLIDNVAEVMDVENYSRFALELTIYMRRLMEKRYGSDSELKEK